MIPKHLYWISIAGALIAGCGESENGNGAEPTPTPSGPVSFTADVQPIFSANCSAYCHLGGGAGYLDLRPEAAYDSLVEIDALCDPGADARVIPGSPESSVLLRRLSGDPDLCGGNPMPPSGSLSAGDLAIIEQWIEDGAPDN